MESPAMDQKINMTGAYNFQRSGTNRQRRKRGRVSPSLGIRAEVGERDLWGCVAVAGI